MLVLVRVRRLYVHPILLRLELLEELAIVLLLVIRLGPVAVHALSTAIVASLVLHLLLRARVEILHTDVFLLWLAFAPGVENINRFVRILFFLILDIADV